MSEKPRAKVVKTDAEWRAILTPEQYYVTRGHGTEMPFTGRYLKEKRPGTYVCVSCGNPLFDSGTKFESGSGWPSFYAPLSKSAVDEIEDISHGMRRVEIRCSSCEAHLGHVFEDGPKETGLRYCMNGCALILMPKESKDGA